MELSELIISKEHKKKLEKELEVLKTKKRVEIIARIKAARDLGDLSENAEYDSARKTQGEIESRIKLIEIKLGFSKVVDTSKVSKEFVGVGSKVTVRQKRFAKKITYEIVNTDEVDLMVGKISNSSPIGKCLMGRKVDDVITLNSPEGESVYTILAIE